MEPLPPNKIISVPDMFTTTAAKLSPVVAVSRVMSVPVPPPEPEKPAAKPQQTDLTEEVPVAAATGSRLTEGFAELPEAENHKAASPKDQAIGQTENGAVIAVAKVDGITGQRPLPENNEPTINKEINNPPKQKMKGIKDYLLQGLMTFFVIAISFIAWNKWEETAARNRAAEFAAAYYSIIKKDTVVLNAAIRFDKQKLMMMDSAIAELHKPDAQMKEPVIARGMVAASASVKFNPSVGNYGQLSSLATLKNITGETIGLMNEYELQVKHIEQTEDADSKFTIGQFFPFTAKYFNTEVSNDLTFGKFSPNKVYFTDRSAVFEKQVKNYIQLIKLLRMRSVTEYENTLAVSEKLLKELKSRYDLTEN
jgi:hypothetical protein